MKVDGMPDSVWLCTPEGTEELTSRDPRFKFFQRALIPLCENQQRRYRGQLTVDLVLGIEVEELRAVRVPRGKEHHMEELGEVVGFQFFAVHEPVKFTVRFNEVTREPEFDENDSEPYRDPPGPLIA